MFKFEYEKFTKKTLPKNFADLILNLEMEIELNDQIQIELIQDLVSLYMDGVEYYESIKDRRHIYFQRKLNELMLKPVFINATQNCDGYNEPKDETQQKRAKFQEQTRRIELDLIYSQTESKEAQVKGIVDEHINQVIKIEKIIKNEIANQSDAFHQRLEKRRSKMTHSLTQSEIVQKSSNRNQKKQIEQIIQIKYIINEEDETEVTTKDFPLKQSKEKIQDIIHKASQIQENKKQIQRRRSVFLNTIQMIQIKRSLSCYVTKPIDELKNT